MSEDDKTNPLEFISELVTGAITLHEMFESWVAGGFTESQALQLLANVIVAGANNDDN